MFLFLVSPSPHHQFSLFLFSGLSLEDSPQDNGVQTNQYSAISPPASPDTQDEPFSTYFEEKVAIPSDVSQVGHQVSLSVCNHVLNVEAVIISLKD